MWEFKWSVRWRGRDAKGVGGSEREGGSGENEVGRERERGSIVHMKVFVTLVDDILFTLKHGGRGEDLVWILSTLRKG